MNKDNRRESSSITRGKKEDDIRATCKEKADFIPIEARFGARVHTLRLARRMPQEMLAIRAQLHRNYISEMERGKRNVSLRVIERIALALDVEIVELFHGKEYG